MKLVLNLVPACQLSFAAFILVQVVFFVIFKIVNISISYKNILPKMVRSQRYLQPCC